MGRIKVVFLFFIVFLFFSIDNVYAAQELTCIYKGGINKDATMLVQTADGNFFVYRNLENKKPDIDDLYWWSVDDNTLKPKYDFKNTIYYDEVINTLTECPRYTREGTIKSSIEGVTYSFYFYDEKTWYSDYELYKKYSLLPDKSNFKVIFSEDNKEYLEEIKNTEWIGVCNYEDVTLYFNRSKLILNNKNSQIIRSSTGFSLNQLLEYYDEVGVCPTNLYRRVDIGDISSGGSVFVSYFLSNVKNTYREPFIKEGSSISDNYKPDNSKDEIDECRDLFSDEFIGGVNKFLSIVRMVVPILLVVLGILDFTKAIFSSSEDAMKKAQAKFIKRIIAAIIVFLLPVLVNLLLDIANNIWEYIDPNSCNIG